MLGVAPPEPTQPEDACNVYVFERAIETRLSNGKRSTLKADLFKHGALVMEAKQGVDVSVPTTARHQGIGKRDGPAWHAAMQLAKGQALGYARSLPAAPPFLVVCDVG